MHVAARFTAAFLLGAAVLPLTACSARPSATPSSPHRTTAPFFGLDVPNADPAETRRVAGILGCAPSVVSIFVKLDSAVTAATLGARTPGGEVPLVTLEPWPLALRSGHVDDTSLSLASVSSGAHDADLARIAAALAAYGRPVYLRYAHEMNGDWYPWAARVNGGSAAAYVGAWRHVHDLFSRAGARNVRWVWAPSALPDGPTGKGGDLAALYPGDSYVDLVGLTGYGHDAGPAERTFGPWLRDIATFTRRPVLLAEIGADGAGKTSWMRSLVPYLESTPSIVGFVWFNTTPQTTGATGHYRIDDSPDQVAAMHEVLDRLSVPCHVAQADPQGTSS